MQLQLRQRCGGFQFAAGEFPYRFGIVKREFPVGERGLQSFSSQSDIFGFDYRIRVWFYGDLNSFRGGESGLNSGYFMEFCGVDIQFARFCGQHIFSDGEIHGKII